MMIDFFKKMARGFLPRKTLTFLAGILARSKIVWLKNYLISRFITIYQVDMREAEEKEPEGYSSFNDFFIRRLKSGARVIGDSLLVSPVDGCVSEVGEIQLGQLLQAKGRYYSVEELLAADRAMSERFSNGRFVTLYLSPKDYHRIHMPILGQLKQMLYIPGTLFSVNPASVRNIPRLFSRNKRLVVYFETEVGLLAIVLVGATVVGSIGTSWHGDLKRSQKHTCFEYDGVSLSKGEEMGYFKLGSTVILLLENNTPVNWADHLRPGEGVQLGENMSK